MSNKSAPKVQFNFVEEPEPGNFSDNELPQSDEEFESYEAEQLAMPEVVEKPKPTRDDIFDTGSSKVVEPVIEPVQGNREETGEVNQQFIYEEDPPKKQKPVKQKKPRKPMSEEHKAKLALAREKAMAVRKAKALEKKQMKEIEKETNNLRKKKKMKEFEQLKTEVNEDIPPQKISNNTNKIPADLIDPQKLYNSITKKDLEDAQLEAITKYEILRKARKEEKRKQQAIDKQKKELLNKINPTKPKYRDGSNPWDMCY